MGEFKKAFTLAEIMIVLVIIGVITAILLPIAIHNAPDENVMKFKKGHNTLLTAIRELVNSDEYYLNGDLGIKADGTLLDGSHVGDCTYFCETLSQIINYKSKSCSEKCSASDITTTFSIEVEADSPYCNQGENKNYCLSEIDKICKSSTDSGPEIVAADGIVYYQIESAAPFGASTKISNWDGSERFWKLKSDKGFIRTYKSFCMDIDGINKGEDPFGYGIRVDGKILYGARAQEWMQKSIQKGD